MLLSVGLSLMLPLLPATALDQMPEVRETDIDVAWKELTEIRVVFGGDETRRDAMRRFRRLARFDLDTIHCLCIKVDRLEGNTLNGSKIKEHTHIFLKVLFDVPTKNAPLRDSWPLQTWSDAVLRIIGPSPMGGGWSFLTEPLREAEFIALRAKYPRRP
jgi:hypothetical protein